MNFTKTKLPLKNPTKPDRNLEADLTGLKNINFGVLIGKYSRQYLSLQAYVALNIPDAKKFSKISKEGSFKSHDTHFDFDNIDFNNNNNESPFKLSKKKLFMNLIIFFKNKPAYILIVVLIFVLLLYLF